MVKDNEGEKIKVGDYVLTPEKDVHKVTDVDNTGIQCGPHLFLSRVYVKHWVKKIEPDA